MSEQNVSLCLVWAHTRSGCMDVRSHKSIIWWLLCNVQSKLHLKTLPLFPFISTAPLQSDSIVQHLVFKPIAKTCSVWSVLYACEWEVKKRLLNCTESETKWLFLIQVDVDNSTVFKGHLQWLASQSLLVFWSSCLNAHFTVKSQNTTALVNSMLLY